MSQKEHWCLITTYGANHLLLPVILSYYRQFYGIPYFLIFCGMTGAHTHEELKQFLSSKLSAKMSSADKLMMTQSQQELTVSEFTTNEFALWAASYPTANYSAELEWHAVRSDLEKWAHRFLPEQITRTILIDNDELLYARENAALESLEGLGFHFVDIIPCPKWPPERLYFSLQGWFYHRQAQPLFRYGKSIALKMANRMRRGRSHGGCKTFHFDRKRLANGTAWNHGSTEYSLGCCFALNYFLDDSRQCHNILRDTSCCYHLGMIYRNHYPSQKLHLFARIQTDIKKRPILDQGRSQETTDLRTARKTFYRFMSESIFPVIEDNFLLPYLRNPITMDA